LGSIIYTLQHPGLYFSRSGQFTFIQDSEFSVLEKTANELNYADLKV